MAMARMMLIDLGALVLGAILLAVGAVMTPGVASPFTFPGLPGYPLESLNVTGQSLIAIGLTLILVSIGYLLAGFRERMMAMEAEMGR